MTKNRLLNTIRNIWQWIENHPTKAIIIAGISVRIIIAILYQHITLYPDTNDYVILAERLLNFDLNGYEGQRSPGYPLFLAFSNISFVITIILQSLAGILTLALTYKLFLLNGINRKISLISTLIISCYLPSVFFDFAVLTESITLLCVSAIFYLYVSIYYKKSNNINYYLGLSLLCGYLVLIKPFYIFLPALLFLVLCIKGFSWKNLFKKYLVVLLIPAFIFLGWSYVNKVNTGYFVSSTFYGFNLAQNCVSFAEKTTPEYAEVGEIYAKYRDNRISDKEEAMVIWEAYPELKEKTGLSFPGLSRKLYDYSISTIKNNPADYLKQVFISWRDFWKTSLYYEYDSFATPHANNIILYICYAERIILQLIKILFILLIPYNIVSSIRKRKITPQLVISVIVLAASILQALVTYGTNSRFSYPFEILIMLSVILNVIIYKQKKVIKLK